MLKKYLMNVVLMTFILFMSSCFAQSTANKLSAGSVFVGSTPGDSEIKSLLTINPEKTVDFVRWELTLNQSKNGSKSYVLNISFGEAQPNTLGFKDGGEKLSLEGVYTVSKDSRGDIYDLKNKTTTISLIKLNENLFQLLTRDKKLMVGNGGWDYTLNRRDFTVNDSTILPSQIISSLDNEMPQVIFNGRTPCLDVAKQYNLQATHDCFKIKWKLTLFRDSKTNAPTTYILQRTQNGQNMNIIEGKWVVIKGMKNNAEAIIYRLDPDKPDESFAFWAADENVLFLMDKENRLFTGNGDFSYTLSKRKQ